MHAAVYQDDPDLARCVWAEAAPWVASVSARAGEVFERAEDSALALGLHTGPEDGPEPDGFRRVAGPFGLVDLDLDPDESLAEIDAIRIYAGYAGWSAGQLDDEISEGAWYVVDGGPADVFDAAPDDLWLRVLRRQQGDLAFVATPSTDPALN